MPRIARPIITNVPYHVTQRGNRRQDVFFSPDHYKRYLEHLAQYSSRYHFDILAYCLMTNHIHIIGIPRKPDSMSRTIQTVHMRHTQFVNRDMGWNGHMWQSRFFSTALDELHLWYAIRYVEQNPMRAGIVLKAQDYTWSSAAFHCGLSDDQVVAHNPEMAEMFDGWSKTLKIIPDDEIIERIRRRTHSGVPCGNDKFIRMISRKLGVDLADRKQGRPRKTDK